MSRYEVTCRDLAWNTIGEKVPSTSKLEVEADKFSFQAPERVAYFYLKDAPSPEAVAADVVHVRRLPGVKYFLDMSNELADDPDFGKSLGLRIIMKTSLYTTKLPKSEYMTLGVSRYLVEDANAPAEVEGHLVEIVCKQELVGNNQFRYWIDEWKVLE